MDLLLEASPRTSYDQIATVYASDMGRNMPFDDVAYYVKLASEKPWRILELGCGTGRITLPLLKAGLNVTAGDISNAMLIVLQKHLWSNCTVSERHRLQIVQMDLRQWPLCGRFSTILCPYSLFTYFVQPSEQRDLLSSVLQHLCCDGCFIVDVFIPSETIRYGELIWDYTRPLDDGRLLQRYKVIEPDLIPGVNIVRRSYRILDHSCNALRSFSTLERVRYFSPLEMEVLLKENGYEVTSIDWDYGSKASAAGARFATFTCCAARSH